MSATAKNQTHDRQCTGFHILLTLKINLSINVNLNENN